MTAPHGTPSRYSNHGCRCDACREAKLAYERDRRRRTGPAYISAAAARAHIAYLRDNGVGLKTVARVSGVSHGALSKLVYGDRTRGRGPSKRIRPATHDKIMTVTIDAAAAGAKIDATATWRLIDEMVEAGAPKSAIAAELGQVGPGLQVSRGQVLASTATAIADLHRRWVNGETILERRDRHGNRTIAQPPDPDTTTSVATAAYRAESVKRLYDEIADIVTARETQQWRRRAQCRTHPTWVWFPSRGDNKTLAAARTVCETCPVAVECAAEGAGQPAGVWGSITANQRRTSRTAA